MTMRPHPAENIPEHRLRDLRLLASDIDDTLTESGHIPPAVLETLQRVKNDGVRVWLVTGRSAAWGQAMSHYLDVDGVIAENGGVICRGEEVRLLADTSLIGDGRARLIEAFERLRKRLPAARATGDNIGRLTDWTIDRATLSTDEVATAAATAEEAGLRCVASSIHVHYFAAGHDKATALGRICEEEAIDDRQQVLTLGDSVNDEPLFNPAYFPFSVGVANVAEYLDQLQHRPLFMLPAPRAAGALWLLRRILVCRGV
ncbi:MAG: HAD family hydrolase [Candidatus Lernaella stagnicola]|nr:HAD family hydrolase [Candidatus Lernaella stagnicola]